MIYYTIIIIYFALAVFVMLGFVLSKQQTVKNGIFAPVSIVIAARNEDAYIEKCLSTIASQNFPKELIEIIVVDDNSSDNTANIALTILHAFSIKHQVIRNSSHLGKKRSLKKAIEQCSHELIISRDADTFTESNEWLSDIVNFYSATRKEFIICPIAVKDERTFLGALQEVESAVLSLFAISSSYFKVPFLCSGANLAFTKRIFYKTKAYENHLHIASGDDVLFLEEVKKLDVNSIAYLKRKNAIVYTYPEKSFKELIDQKIRWSSKVFRGISLFNWLTAVIIAISNFLWLWAIFSSLFSQQNALFSLFFVLAKLLIDILLVFLASSFIKVRARGIWVLLTGCIYPLYASFIVTLALLIKPKWKSN